MIPTGTAAQGHGVLFLSFKRSTRAVPLKKPNIKTKENEVAVVPDFRITPHAKPWACRICTAPTTSWSVETFISEMPIETILGEVGPS